nr:MAG TPA: hypothetical protein [Caudoviricetes sp.]DAL76958.1 MAG TPA: hypothetical protein [Bacteriophage sp.]DAL89275.1 MAG TPA: hypothetical protein [Caudoviricetes sp.]DAU78643.1 MAG TPA: hypothetical protein [Caudoviricetes sp.]
MSKIFYIFAACSKRNTAPNIRKRHVISEF